MNGLDFSVQNRVNGLNSGYVSKPSELQHADNSPRATEKKRTFDKSYCQTVQAYFAPNFIKAGEKPCSVTEYIAKLLAAGLKDGKDFETKGRESGDNFGLDIILKDSFGRVKKCTSWENGLEAENFMGYDKYSYNSLDPSYKKISSYSKDNELFYIAETTSAIPQKDFTEDGISYEMKPKEYMAYLKSSGRDFQTVKEPLGVNGKDFKFIINEPVVNGSDIVLNSTQWLIRGGKLVSVCQDLLEENGNLIKQTAFYSDGSTEVTHYFNQ